jgi:hypothetical protein
MYCAVLHCTVCTVLHCTFVYCTVLYYIVLYCTVMYCTVLYCTSLYCTVMYYTALYCTALHCTVLYCTALHCIVPSSVPQCYKRANTSVPRFSFNVKGGRCFLWTHFFEHPAAAGISDCNFTRHIQYQPPATQILSALHTSRLHFALKSVLSTCPTTILSLH